MISPPLIPQLIDETHAECVARAQPSLRYEPQPPEHDAHVTAWEVELWELVEQIAWLRRQETALHDGH